MATATKSNFVPSYTAVDALTGDLGDDLEELVVFAATHYVAGDETTRRAVQSIEVELRERLAVFEKENKLLEAQRLRLRTEHDLEMLAAGSEALLDLSGLSPRASALLRRHVDVISEVAMDTDAVLRDFDTPESLAQHTP